jgi:hypothetical protein
MGIVTAIGVLICLIFVLQMASHSGEVKGRESPDDDFDILLRKSGLSTYVKRVKPPAPKSVSTTGLHVQRKDGEICWRTGMHRGSCTCKRCKNE